MIYEFGEEYCVNLKIALDRYTGQTLVRNEGMNFANMRGLRAKYVKVRGAAVQQLFRLQAKKRFAARLFEMSGRYILRILLYMRNHVCAHAVRGAAAQQCLRLQTKNQKGQCIAALLPNRAVLDMNGCYFRPFNKLYT